jgi:hypothetical protein
MAAAEGQGRMTDDGGWGSYASPVQFANSIEQARELMADGGDHLDASTLAINAKYAALNQVYGVTIACDDGHPRPPEPDKWPATYGAHEHYSPNISQVASLFGLLAIVPVVLFVVWLAVVIMTPLVEQIMR